MIVNGLKTHEIKRTQTLLVCAKHRMQQQYDHFRCKFVSERQELLEYYEGGIRELSKMIQFAQKAIKVSKQKGDHVASARTATKQG